eukprot:6186521-Pleurochrysis_carterae.AAC.1
MVSTLLLRRCDRASHFARAQPRTLHCVVRRMHRASPRSVRRSGDTETAPFRATESRGTVHVALCFRVALHSVVYSARPVPHRARG